MGKGDITDVAGELARARGNRKTNKAHLWAEDKRRRAGEEQRRARSAGLGHWLMPGVWRGRECGQRHWRRRQNHLGTGFSNQRMHLPPAFHAAHPSTRARYGRLVLRRGSRFYLRYARSGENVVGDGSSAFNRAAAQNGTMGSAEAT